MVLTPSQLQTATAKTCKEHSVLKHDLFTSYRSKIDGEFVAQLVPFLEKLGSRILCRRVCVFWDKLCLKSGLKWEDGFIGGLTGSYVIMYVLSEESLRQMIENVQNGIEDYVLLEIEAGVSLADARILPILIDSAGTTFSEITGHGSLFNPTTYPDLLHVKSSTNFRKTMTDLFLNQVIHTAPDHTKIHNIAYDIVDLIEPLPGDS
ncbi:hypothetical protein HK100_009021, partial [Physocladia obscura]